jgi:hypothetical protein
VVLILGGVCTARIGAYCGDLQEPPPAAGVAVRFIASTMLSAVLDETDVSTTPPLGGATPSLAAPTPTTSTAAPSSETG